MKEKMFVKEKEKEGAAAEVRETEIKVRTGALGIVTQ